MRKVFVTYGDNGYEQAVKRILIEAKSTNCFDSVYGFNSNDISPRLRASDIISVKRGGGLWSWKPDIILSTMENMSMGDILVYSDSGCSLYCSKEWFRFWKILENNELIAQRIYQINQNWTRKEIVEYFSANGTAWLKQSQYLATVIILRVSEFSFQFVREWRDIMINHPDFAMDVPEEKLSEQLPGFRENRHDQAIYSALVYKYLNDSKIKKKIYTQWEHIEDFDPLFKQAIRATRLRQGQHEAMRFRLLGGCKNIIKVWFLRPLYWGPMQWWFGSHYVLPICYKKDSMININDDIKI